MKRVIAILAAASLLAFASCKNAANEIENEAIIEETAPANAEEDDDDDFFEEIITRPSK